MFKFKLILAAFISIISCAAYGTDEAIGAGVGGLPLDAMGADKEPDVKIVDGVPVVEDNRQQKLKSVKDLFKSSKNSVPKAPNVISNKPEMVDVDSETTKAPTPTQPQAAPDAAVAKPEENSTLDSGADSADFNINTEGKSIMFDQTNIYRVMRVLAAYIESNSNKVDETTQNASKKSLEELQQELLAKLNPENFVKGKKDIVTVRLPAYVKLDSILFRSPTNKKAWINKHKFTEGENNGEITISAIQKDYALIQLSIKDSNIDTKKLLAQLKKSKSAAKIVIDTEKQFISFKISVNQYIDLEKLQILEGDFPTASLDSSKVNTRYYDPMKPEDRFVPLDDAKAAAEAEIAEERKKVEEKTTPDVKFEAIDGNEELTPTTEELKDGTASGTQNSDGSIRLNINDPDYKDNQDLAKEGLEIDKKMPGIYTEQQRNDIENMAAGKDLEAR